MILSSLILIHCSKNNNTISRPVTPEPPPAAFVSPHHLVFVTGISNNVYAINPDDGTVKWKVNLSANYNSYMTLTPTVANGVVYAGYVNDSLAALNAETGQVLWRIAIPVNGASQACPLVYNNILYIGGGKSFYAINTADGSTNWAYTNPPNNEGNSFSECSPTYNNGKIYVACNGGNYEGLYCLDAVTGAYNGRYLPTNSYAGKASPCIINNYIFALFYSSASSAYGGFVKLDINNQLREIPGAFGVPETFISSPTVYDNSIFVGSDSSLYAINDAAIPSEGTLKWKFRGTSFMGSSSPTVANGKAYIGSEEGIIYCVDAQSGVKIWEFKTKDFGSLSGNQTSPTVADNILYYGSANGLFALNAQTGEMIWRCDIPYPCRSPCVLSKTGDVAESGLSGWKN